MTTPPYTGRNSFQHTGKHHPTSLEGPGVTPTPTPISSHRDNDFTLEDIQFLSQTFGIVDMEYAESTTQTRVWVEQRPGTDTSIQSLNDLEDRYMTIHRGDFIRAAYRLPDGTERVIWEHRVFDDDTPTALNPGTALVEAQAANWEPVPGLETPSQKHLQQHD